MLASSAERTTWASLKVHDRVGVREHGKEYFEAVVDVLTEDRTVVWVLPTMMTGRRASHTRNDGEIVVLNP